VLLLSSVEKYLNFGIDITLLDTVTNHFASKRLGASSCGIQVLFICIILLHLEKFYHREAYPGL